MWRCSAGRPAERAGDLFTCPSSWTAFDIKGISKSPAIFDIDKLKYFNSAYIRAMTPEQFAAVAAPYIRQTVKNPAIDPAADRAAAAAALRGAHGHSGEGGFLRRAAGV